MANRDLVTRVILRGKDELSAVFGSVQAKAVALFTALTAFVGARLFGGAVEDAARMEAQLDKVAAKGGYTAAEMARLKDVAEDIGPQFGATGLQAAEGLEVLAAAGLQAEQALQTLPAVLALAKSEGIGLEQAATLVTDAVSLMGLSFADAGRVADVFVKGANLATVSGSELGLALKYAGAEARTAGLSLEGTVALLDQFAQNGLRGEQAGTMLRTILAQLGNPASEARRELASLGVTSGRLQDVIAGLAASGPRGERAIRAFGVEAGPGLRALLAGGNAAVQGFADQLDRAGGTATQVAGQMGGNLLGAWDRFTAAIGRVRRALVEPILGPLADELDGFTGQLRDAATDGGLENFRASLLEAFRAAAGGVRQFVAEFDFRDALDRVGRFSTDVVSAFGSIADAGRTSADAVKLGWNGLLTTLGAVGAGALRLASYIVDGFAATEAALARVGLGSTQTVETLRADAERLRDASADMAGVSVRAYDDTRAALERLTAGAAPAVAAQQQTAQAAQEAAAGLALTADELDRYTEAQRVAADMAAVSARAVTSAEDAKRAELAATRAELERLQAAYRAALGAGNTQEAAELLQQIEALRASLRGVSAQASSTGQALEDAFTGLGLTSQRALEQAAVNARRAFDTIRQAGTASAEDVKRAFLAYAEAQLKATADSSASAQALAVAALQSQAAGLGLSDALAKLLAARGRDTAAADRQAEANGRLAGALGAAAGAAGRATPALERHADAIDQTTTANAAAAGAQGEVNRQAVASVSALEQQRQRWLDLSQAAGAYFQTLLERANIPAATMRVVDDRMFETIKAQFDRLTAQATDLQGRLSAALDGGRVDAQALAQAMGLVASQTQRVASGIGLLDAEQLSGLQAAIDAARQKLAELNEQARAAASSVADELDRELGRLDAVEARRAEQQIASLRAQLGDAQASGERDAVRELQRAIRDAETLHKVRMDKIRAEAAERAAREREATKAAAAQAVTPAPAAGVAAQPAVSTVRTVSLALGLPGGQTVNVPVPEGEADRVVRDLELAAGRSRRA